MKRIIKPYLIAAVAAFLAASTFLGTSAGAQVSAGVGFLGGKLKESQGGVSMTTHTYGIYAGASYNLPIKESSLSLEPGLYYGYETGTMRIPDAGLADVVLQDLYLPLRLRIDSQVSKKLVLFTSAGPMLGVGLGGEIRNGGIAVNLFDSSAMSGSTLKRFDFLLGLNCGMIISERYQIRFGFDKGLLDVENGETAAHRSSLHLGFAFAF